MVALKIQHPETQTRKEPQYMHPNPRSTTTEPYKAPLDGAFTIIVFGLYILMIRLRTNGRYELPGGGRDPGETLLKAAIREIKEETKFVVGESSFGEVAYLVQRVVRKEGLRYGRLKLFQVQHFVFPFQCSIGEISDPDYGVVKNMDGSLLTTDEAECVQFVHAHDIFRETFKVSLGHKRLVLHWLNYMSALAPEKIRGKLGDPVTVEIPGLGLITL